MGAIDTNATLGELVREHPGRTRVLEELGIDYCCGGRRPLAEACAEKGLDPQVVAQRLVDADRTAPEDQAGDLSKMSMTQLTQHIERTHHVYLKRELPRLQEITRKTASVHGSRAPQLQELSQTIDALAAEMQNHLAKEEQVLFPSLRQLEQTGSLAGACFGTVRNPIRMMEYEHQNAAELLERIRALADGYTVPPWGCDSYRAMAAGLRQLEADTHQHIHKENNILFPMAVEAEGRSG